MIALTKSQVPMRHIGRRSIPRITTLIQGQPLDSLERVGERGMDAMKQQFDSENVFFFARKDRSCLVSVLHFPNSRSNLVHCAINHNLDYKYCQYIRNNTHSVDLCFLFYKTNRKLI